MSKEVVSNLKSTCLASINEQRLASIQKRWADDDWTHISIQPPCWMSSLA